MHLLLLEDIRITSIQDGHATNTEELTTGGTEVGVGTGVVVYLALGKKSVVLDLRLAKRRGVVGDDDELGLSGAESLDHGLVTKGSLARLHHELDARVDRLGVLLASLLDGNHDFYY